MALVLAALAVGRPVWDGRVAYVAADHAAAQLPWSAAHAVAPAGPRHPDLSDEATALYPAWRHVARRLAAGDVPLWNPDVQAGTPCLANPQWRVLDPQMWVLAALERAGGKALFDRGLGWLAALRLAAALLGAYLLARRLGLGCAGATCAALGFGGSGFVLGWLASSLGHVAPTLPWLLLGIEGLAGPRPRRSVVGVAACAWLAIVGGHPETSFFVLVAAALWAARLCAAERAAGVRALAALACGTLLAAPLWVPFYEYLLRSGALLARALAREEREGPPLVAAGLALALVATALLARRRFVAPRRWEPPAFALAFVVLLCLLGRHVGLTSAPLFGPDLMGGPGSGRPFAGEGSYLELSALWVAAPVLVLACAAALAPAAALRRRELVLWLGGGAWLLAADVAPLRGLWRLLPLVGDAATSRAAVVAMLMLALAAGEALERRLPAARETAALVLAVLAGLQTPLFGGRDVRGQREVARIAGDPDDELVAFAQRPEPVPAPGRLPLAGVLNEAVDVSAARVALALWVGSSFERRLEAPVTLVPVPGGGTAFRCEQLDTARLERGAWALTLELLAADAGGQPRVIGHRDVGRISVEREVDFATLSGVLFALALLLAALPFGGRWRRRALLAVLLVQAGRYAWHAHPPVPLGEVFPETVTTDVLRARQADGRVLGGPGVLPYNTALVHGLRTLDGYDALDVGAFDGYRAFAMKPGTNPLLDWNARGVDVDAPAFRLLGATHLATATPFVHPRYRLVAGPRDGAEVFVYEDTDPYPRAFCVARTVPREEVLADPRAFDPLGAAFLERGVTWRPDAPCTTATVTGLVIDGDEVRLTATLDGEGLLVLCEQAFPGWTVTVDGEERPVWTVDSLFRGVALEAGAHAVVFRFRPRSLRLGLFLAGFGVLALAVLVQKCRSSSSSST